MTSSLTVIGLVTRLKSSTQTTYGEAIYLEKISNKNVVFAFKQFTNAQHNYNEAFRKGDLVSFGGKFTIDDQKLLVSISIFCLYVIIIDFKLYLFFFVLLGCRRNGLQD